MVQVSRRKVLQLGGSALVTGLSGCGTLLGDSAPDPTLGELEVTNLDLRPHTVSVLVLDGDEPVYSAEVDVEAAEPATDGSSGVTTAGGGSFEGFPTDVEGHVLHAWRDTQPTSEWGTFDFQEVSASCFGLDIQIGDTQQSNPGDVSIWYTTDSDVCEDAANHDGD